VLVMTTVMITLIAMEVLFEAGVLVGALLVPHLIIHSSQAAPVYQAAPMHP
jgi:hypothetical protein